MGHNGTDTPAVCCLSAAAALLPLCSGFIFPNFLFFYFFQLLQT
jgi:hypothetical protein